jgi:serine/threonine protein kinase
MSQISNNHKKNIGHVIIKQPKSNSLSPDTIKCKRIGNYILSNTIGTGTFSKVKLGIHIPTQQKVAIKILDKDKIKDESDIERIRDKTNNE